MYYNDNLYIFMNTFQQARCARWREWRVCVQGWNLSQGKVQQWRSNFSANMFRSFLKYSNHSARNRMGSAISNILIVVKRRYFEVLLKEIITLIDTTKYSKILYQPDKCTWMNRKKSIKHALQTPQIKYMYVSSDYLYKLSLYTYLLQRCANILPLIVMRFWRLRNDIENQSHE